MRKINQFKINILITYGNNHPSANYDPEGIMRRSCHFVQPLISMGFRLSRIIKY